MDGREIMTKIVSLIDPLILLIFSAGVLVFMWGLVMFIIQADSTDGRKTGVQHMIWGILGIFIMATVFGIISIITSTLGVSIPSGF